MLDPVVLAGVNFGEFIRRGLHIAYCKSFTVEFSRTDR